MKYSVADDKDRVPLDEEGRVMWFSNKELAISEGLKHGMTYLLILHDNGSIVGKERLSEYDPDKN